jgi:Protein of unknown function (DUF1353)
MFLTKLIISAFLPNEWALEALLAWFSPAHGRITVPAGFITDLASIPRLLRGVLNINGKSRRAAVLHDWLYCSKLFPREIADRIFYEALVAEGMNKGLARVYWSGVRSGGWLYYGKRSGLTREDFVTEEAFQYAKADSEATGVC